MEQKLVDEGAELDKWNKANTAALAKMEEDELVLQLEEMGEEEPSCLVVSVGGGGLALGLLQGLDRHGLKVSVLLGMQTEGAASFCKSVEQGKLGGGGSLSGASGGHFVLGEHCQLGHFAQVKGGAENDL
jgi:cysteine synthase